MKEIEETTELMAILENPLDFIDSTDREEIICQIPNLFRKIAEMLFEGYDIHICDSKGIDHFYSFAEIEFYYHKKGVLNRDVDNCVYPAQRILSVARGSVKLSKGHHAAIKEERYIPHASHA